MDEIEFDGMIILKTDMLHGHTTGHCICENHGQICCECGGARW